VTDVRVGSGAWLGERWEEGISEMKSLASATTRSDSEELFQKQGAKTCRELIAGTAVSETAAEAS
jgi:hypothetical protein